MMELQPAKLLETLGIDDYAIDYENFVVYLSEEEYLRIADYFEKSRMSQAIEIGGWRWCKS